MRTTLTDRDPIYRDAAATHAPALDARDIATPQIYERAGPFELRLVSSAKELRQTQRLRYDVFYEEGGALASPESRAKRRDFCPFDAICDHLIVLDTEAEDRSGSRKPKNGKPKIVGTYRLLRREIADRHHGFYSQGEFDLAPMLARHPDKRFLELGRSCVHASYRSKRVIELLWRGLWLYATHHGIDAMIGCASFPGTDLEAMRLPLSFLLNVGRADETYQVRAWAHCAAPFEPLPPEAFDARRALVALPPLIKAYLRTGARFGGSVVIDRQFGTADVFTVMLMGDMEERYRVHYGAPSCVSGAPVA